MLSASRFHVSRHACTLDLGNGSQLPLKNGTVSLNDHANQTFQALRTKDVVQWKFRPQIGMLSTAAGRFSTS